MFSLENKSKLKRLISPFFFYLFLSSLLVVEGWGMPNGRFISIMLVSIMPSFLFLADGLLEYSIKFPRNITIITLIFLLFSFISLPFAVSIDDAFEHQLFYIGLFLISIYCYNHKKEIKHYLPLYITLSTLLTMAYAFSIRYLVPESMEFFAFRGNYQFIKQVLDGHDPIGPFILVPLIFVYLYSQQKQQIRYYLLLIFLFIILIFSYLRAAYISIASIILLDVWLNRANISKRAFVMKFAMVSITIISFVAITYLGFKLFSASENEQYIINAINNNQSDILYRKSNIEFRIGNIAQALSSIQDNWLFGVGSYNYTYSSFKYASKTSQFTGSSHNIVLDFFVENGLIAGGIFLSLVILLLVSSRNILKSKNILNKSIYASILALFILFMTSNYHKSYYLLTIFFTFGFLLYEETNNYKDKSGIRLIASLILFVLSLNIVNANLAYRKNMPNLAIKLYPIDRNIQESYTYYLYRNGDIKSLNKQIDIFSRLYPRNFYALEHIADIYERLSDYENALLYYNKTLDEFPLDYFYIKKVYKYTKLTSGQKKAAEFISQHTKKYNIISNNKYDQDIQYLEEWCIRNKLECY